MMASVKQNLNCTVEIKDLVKLMIQNPPLLENWSQFCDYLNSQPQSKQKWQFGINNTNLKFYNVFSEMIQEWVSSSGPKTVEDLCDVLKQLDCGLAVAEMLEISFGGECIINVPQQEETCVVGKERNKWPITHGLKDPVTNFGGRSKELDELNCNISTKNVVLVCGIGGIGKTELCRKFANDILCYRMFFIKIKTFNRSISRIWLHGDTLDTLRDSVLKLARKLGVKNVKHYSKVSELFECLASFILENCTRLLVIIDNVDVVYNEFVDLIQIVKNSNLKKRMFVIVTSRDSMVLENAGFTMKLGVLSKKQARKMLKSSIDILNESDADELCELVQYFPLALQQAVAYIKQQKMHFLTPNYSVLDYVKEFEVKKREMLGHELNKFEHDYALTTLITWDMTISKIGEIQKYAVEILRMLAYLEPDGTELKFLERLCQKCGINYKYLDILQKYSLVKIEKELVSVHRLVQEVMRGKVGLEYSKSLFDSVLLSCGQIKKKKGFSLSVHEIIQLNNVCKFVYGCEMHDNCSLFFYRILLFLLERDRIECALEYIKLHYPHIQYPIIGCDFSKKEYLVKVILWGLYNNDNYNSADVQIKNSNFIFGFNGSQLLVKEAFEIAEKYLESGSKTLNDTKHKMALQLFKDGAYSESVNLSQQVMRSSGDRFEIEGAYTTIIDVYVHLLKNKDLMKNEEISNMFSEVDYGEFSLKFLEKIWKFCEEVLGKDNIIFVRGQMRILEEISKLGYEKESIELCGNILDSSFDTEYEKAFEYLSVTKNITYADQKDILEKILKDKGLKLGEYHRNTIRIKLLLAKNLENLDKFIKALRLFKELSAIKLSEWWTKEDLIDCQFGVTRLEKRFGDSLKS